MVKINSEEIQKNILTNQSQKTRGNISREFDLFLKKEIEKGDKNSPSINISPSQIEAQGLETVLRIAQNQEQNKIMDKIELTLKKWEKYSHNLNQGNIRTSENTLTSIIEELSNMEKDLNTGEYERDEGMSSLINEMKIMALSEKARLYRGEYT